MAYGNGLKLVNSADKRAKRAAWFRGYYADKLRDPSKVKGNPWQLMRLPGELESLRITQELDRNADVVDRARIKTAICSKCGNHRAFNPDRDGKCRACVGRRILKRKNRLKEEGRWGTMARLAKHRRRALKRANGGSGTVTVADWQWVLDRYGSKCLCCGSDAPPTMDHVVPLSMGGPHDRSNLQPLCNTCNGTKSATTADYRFDRPLAPMRRDPVVVRYVDGTD